MEHFEQYIYEDNELFHYGMPRRSGRYPYGSGEEPFQHNGPDLLGRADQLKKKNPKISDADIAKQLGMSTTDYQAMYSYRKDMEKAEMRAKAYELKNNKQLSNTKIAEMLGTTEGTVRNMFKEREDRRLKELNDTISVLENELKNHKYIDVSRGTEVGLDISRDRLKAAVNRMAVEGKVAIHNVNIEQMGTGKKTTISVIGPVDSTWSDAQKNRHELGVVGGYIESDTKTHRGIEFPSSVKSSRVAIRYAEDGGIDKDGVIELRRGCKDLDLGKASYAQVRIAVDGTHYLKGMAMYGPDKDFPKGTDIIFNTNKGKDYSKMEVLKKMKKSELTGEIDQDNPFGTTIKSQSHYKDGSGKERLSPINIVREEGDWDTWSKTLSAQFLSKQPIKLINKQLNLTIADKKAEYEEIKSINNPIVKKHLLEKFADSCDSDSAYLKAAALPRQGSHVILPLPKMAPNEIYAPNYKNGEKVILIRYPHAGTFEIPELRVNNTSTYAKRTLGQAKDAVGINPKVASKLSGADFDGDTVMVIPVNNRVKIQSSPSLKGLKDFEPKEVYKGYEGMPTLKKSMVQTEMGKISNLITDMTLLGAPMSEIERAVKHSMVVIDAEKHKLNYKLSEKENGISALRKEYSSQHGGANTLISRAKGRYDVPERSDYYKIDPKTGEKITRPTNRMKSVYDKNKEEWVKKPAMQKSKNMYETKDARTLISEKHTAVEVAYAKYANEMKAMANKARLDSLKVTPLKYSPSAAKAYAKEVESLDKKLKVVDAQKPLERKAQALADKTVRAAKEDNPQLYDDYEALKKVKYQALKGARERVGKADTTLEITDREWAAIQSGALRNTTATRILQAADMDKVRERATPRTNKGVSTATEMRIKSLLAAGTMTQAEIAQQLGVSVSTIRKYM